MILSRENYGGTSQQKYNMEKQQLARTKRVVSLNRYVGIAGGRVDIAHAKNRHSGYRWSMRVAGTQYSITAQPVYRAAPPDRTVRASKPLHLPVRPNYNTSTIT